MGCEIMINQGREGEFNRLFWFFSIVSSDEFKAIKVWRKKYVKQWWNCGWTQTINTNTFWSIKKTNGTINLIPFILFKNKNNKMQLDLFLPKKKNGTIQTQFFYYEEWKWDNKIQFFCIGENIIYLGKCDNKDARFFFHFDEF